MRKLYLYSSKEWEVIQSMPDNHDLNKHKEQIKTIATILNSLVGQGVLWDMGEYLATKLGLEDIHVKEALKQFVNEYSYKYPAKKGK